VATLDTLTSIAVIIIAVQVFIIMLVPLVLFFFSIRGINWVQKQVQGYGPQVRGVFRQAAQITEDTSLKVTAPLIEVKANAARVGRMRAALAALFTGKGVRS
jgi:hypothetical protein